MKRESYRNMMYTQEIEHLPAGGMDAVLAAVKGNLQPAPVKWAAIIHDKDTKEDGTPAAPHVHIMMQFANARSVKQVAKEIGDQPQYIEIWKGRPENGFSYLIHATENARAKHQYNATDVIANFDYVKFISDIASRVKNVGKSNLSKKIDQMLDLLAAGEITLEQIKGTISGSLYAKHSAQFDKAQSLYLERSADQFYRKMKENNETVKVYWLYGATGTGKTRLAESVLSNRNEPYYKTSAKKDPFEFYSGEHSILLDELRPEDIPYAELLSMFDPYSRGRAVASSRYYNKKLAVSQFFVTTPYDPVSFVHHYIGLDSIDMGNQLYRRLDSVLCLDQDYIYHMIYDSGKDAYCYCEKSENTYSRKYSEEHKIFVPYTDTLFDEITNQTDGNAEDKDSTPSETQLAITLNTEENKEDHAHEKERSC